MFLRERVDSKLSSTVAISVTLWRQTRIPAGYGVVVVLRIKVPRLVPSVSLRRREDNKPGISL